MLRSQSLREAPVGAGEMMDSHAAGGTGMSGKSNQAYHSAELIDHDLSGQVTIHVRLVCPKPALRPLHPKTTAIPPPLT